MNNWYVITGAPCSGKSTTLYYLRQKGYKTVPEAARIYIDGEINAGKTIEQIRENEKEFLEKIFEMVIMAEKKLPQNEVFFLDRGMADTIAYLNLYSYPVKPSIIKMTKKSKYKKMFLFERLPYKKDYTRTEDESVLQKLEDLLERAYAEYGTPVVRVPVLPINIRVEFILSNL
jgi:predicted ATPase